MTENISIYPIYDLSEVEPKVEIVKDDFVRNSMAPFICGFVVARGSIPVLTRQAGFGRTILVKGSIGGFKVRMANGKCTFITDDVIEFIAR